MKYVIVLFLFFSLGCSNDPTPNALDLPKPKTPSETSFTIQIDGDSFYYQKKKIENKEIRNLIQKFKKDNKGKRKIVIEPKKNAKMEYVVYLMELARKEDLEALLQSVD